MSNSYLVVWPPDALYGKVSMVHTTAPFTMRKSDAILWCFTSAWMCVCRYAKMAGSALIPPLGEAARVAVLGPLLPADLQVEGTNWKASTADIAIAGTLVPHERHPRLQAAGHKSFSRAAAL